MCTSLLTFFNCFGFVSVALFTPISSFVPFSCDLMTIFSVMFGFLSFFSFFFFFFFCITILEFCFAVTIRFFVALYVCVCVLGGVYWSRKWQHTPVFLPGKFQRQKSLVGYSPWVTKSQTRLTD